MSDDDHRPPSSMTESDRAVAELRDALRALEDSLGAARWAVYVAAGEALRSAFGAVAARGPCPQCDDALAREIDDALVARRTSASRETFGGAPPAEAYLEKLLGRMRSPDAAQVADARTTLAQIVQWARVKTSELRAIAEDPFWLITAAVDDVVAEVREHGRREGACPACGDAAGLDGMKALDALGGRYAVHVLDPWAGRDGPCAEDPDPAEATAKATVASRPCPCGGLFRIRAERAEDEDCEIETLDVVCDRCATSRALRVTVLGKSIVRSASALLSRRGE